MLSSSAIHLQCPKIIPTWFSALQENFPHISLRHAFKVKSPYRQAYYSAAFKILFSEWKFAVSTENKGHWSYPSTHPVLHRNAFERKVVWMIWEHSPKCMTQFWDQNALQMPTICFSRYWRYIIVQQHHLLILWRSIECFSLLVLVFVRDQSDHKSQECNKHRPLNSFTISQQWPSTC